MRRGIIGLIFWWSLIQVYAQDKSQQVSPFVAIPALVKKVNTAASTQELGQLYGEFERNFPAEGFAQVNFLLDQVRGAAALKYVEFGSSKAIVIAFQISDNLQRWKLLEKIPDKDWQSSVADSIGHALLLKLAHTQRLSDVIIYAEYLSHTKGHSNALDFLFLKDKDGKGSGLHPIYYAILYADNGDYEVALKLLTPIIKSGKADPYAKGLLEQIWYQAGNAAGSYAAFYVEMMKELRKEIVPKLLEDEKKVKAPDFQLLDLNGELVKLSDLRGKTIFLDFWATWCGPCIASFPGLAKVQANYKVNPNVVFLFVNTMEREINSAIRLQQVKGFIEEKKLPFQILMDNRLEGKYEVASAYGVGSIPAKLIIDKNGYIRFALNGFKGSEEELIEEVGFLIDYTLDH